MKKVKSIISLLLITVLLMGSVIGCSGTSSKDKTGSTDTDTNVTEAPKTETGEDKGPVKLRLWAHWGSEQRRPTIEKIVQSFNDKYADQGITAEYVYVPFNDIETKMIASITAGNTANVVITGVEDLNAKAMRNQATDITEYVPEGFDKNFYPSFWDMVKWNDKVYSLPFVIETHMVYYNKAMFAAAGINADEIKTWDDMVNASKKLDETLKGKDDYMIAFYPTLGNFGFNDIAAANGGGVYDTALNPMNPALTSDANIQALEHMKVFADMYGKDMVQSVIASDASGAQDLFLSGKVAMIGQSSAYLATIEQYNGGNIDYGVFPYPAGPSATGDHPYTWGDGFVATVPYGAPNLEESVLLAEYLSTEGAAIWGSEQKEFMAATEANNNANAEIVGWDAVTDMMNYTIVTQDSIYAPNAEVNVKNAVDSILINFEATDVKATFEQVQQDITKAIEDEKFIFGQ
jgi:multiple sugar transport system substrate-binding protein